MDFSDDELLGAMAANTDAVSDLLHQRVQLDDEIGNSTDPLERSELLNSYVGTVNNLESEYRACVAELHRRYRS